VIGINSAIASLGESDTAQTGSIGVGFAIPIDYARSVAEEIIRTGTVTHPYLGVVPSTVDQDNPLPGGPDAGAYLRQVVSGSPAAKSGLRAGDVVVALDREPITSADDLFVAARDHKIGEVVTVTYIRAGARHQAQVTLGERPDN
jgi:putative serine protease PepD